MLHSSQQQGSSPVSMTLAPSALLGRQQVFSKRMLTKQMNEWTNKCYTHTLSQTILRIYCVDGTVPCYQRNTDKGEIKEWGTMIWPNTHQFSSQCKCQQVKETTGTIFQESHCLKYWILVSGLSDVLQRFLWVTCLQLCFLQHSTQEKIRGRGGGLM